MQTEKPRSPQYRERTSRFITIPAQGGDVMKEIRISAITIVHMDIQADYYSISVMGHRERIPISKHKALEIRSAFLHDDTVRWIEGPC